MVSKINSESSYLVSTDIGFMRVRMMEVSGYDVEDIVHDKALSLCRAVQLLLIGKMVDPTMPTTSRTISSIWLNNKEELL